ncbi:hypothetical protein [Nocardia suismassiliense]|uniref:hypothetical protein n=1 Tax=Nocardia suismassiliense TaxID=2077092 RepID=UPI00131F2B35|nr:hypothetical protein [Nocardia suismassiliense]
MEFFEGLAERLYGSFTRLGGWESATGVDGPLLNPSAAELTSAIRPAANGSLPFMINRHAGAIPKALAVAVPA